LFHLFNVPVLLGNDPVYKIAVGDEADDFAIHVNTNHRMMLQTLWQQQWREVWSRMNLTICYKVS